MAKPPRETDVAPGVTFQYSATIQVTLQGPPGLDIRAQLEDVLKQVTTVTWSITGAKVLNMTSEQVFSEQELIERAADIALRRIRNDQPLSEGEKRILERLDLLRKAQGQ